MVGTAATGTHVDSKMIGEQNMTTELDTFYDSTPSTKWLKTFVLR